MKNKNLIYILFLILITSFLFVPDSISYSQILTREGKEYGTVKGAFRHRWWNYYERGLSYLEGRFYEEAISDFEKALKQRPEDKRMARTYGMHFIDYFPNREMGLAYFLAGEYEKAKDLMEASDGQQPSAKARYYLDRIRKELLEQEGSPVSVPELFIELPKEKFWTRDDPVTVSGFASDDKYVSEISIGGKSLYIETSDKRIDFNEKLVLDQGEHTLEIIAENLQGGQTRQQFVLHVDRLAPVITLEPYPADIKIKDYIKGYLYDESGRIFLSVNGETIPLEEGEEVAFNVPVNPENGKIHLIARDRIGNETCAEIDIGNLASRRHVPMLASLDFPQIVSDAGLNLASLLGNKDEDAPVIRLPGWTDTQTVFIERIYLEGEVRDENEIEELSVNGTSVLRRKGPMIFFNHLVNLEKGKNVIQVTARDEKGNIAKKEISIIREVPKVFQHDSRLSLALFPFETKGPASGMTGRYGDLFFVKLMDQNRFRILEREKLDIILQEQKLSSTDIVDRNTALKIGRLMAAQTSLVGAVIETEIGIEIVARLIDNETSEVLAEEDVYDEAKDRSALSAMAEGLAIKFHRDFPLMEGIILQKKGDALFTDLGREKIRPNMRLIIYREGEPIRHPVTNKLMGCDTEIIGYGLVSQVMDEMSRVELTKGLKPVEVKETDRVLPQ